MAEAVIDKEKVYKATTGEEAIDLILNKFYEELVNSGMFPLHRTWHEFEFVGGVRVKGWSTKTEEVKFEVSQRQPTPPRTPENDLQETQSRIDVRLAPAPPSLLRESFPDIPCPKCGKIFHSKPSLQGHLNRWCKTPEKGNDETDGVSIRTDNANLPASNSGEVAPDQTADAA